MIRSGGGGRTEQSRKFTEEGSLFPACAELDSVPDTLPKDIRDMACDGRRSEAFERAPVVVFYRRALNLCNFRPTLRMYCIPLGHGTHTFGGPCPCLFDSRVRSFSLPPQVVWLPRAPTRRRTGTGRPH